MSTTSHMEVLKRQGKLSLLDSPTLNIFYSLGCETVRAQLKFNQTYITF